MLRNIEKLLFQLLLVLILRAPCVSCTRYPGDNGEVEELIIVLGLTFLFVTNIRKRKKPPKMWVNPYLQDRRTKGRYHRDFADLKSNPSVFRENFHVSPNQFDSLLKLLKSKLEPKLQSRKSDSICAEEKLCLTLEFLASGSLQRHIASVYRISKQRIGPIIENTCDLIFETLKTQCIPDLSKSKWLQVSNEFNARWNFPNCLGAIDGKHVAIKSPQNAGSQFYNYKGFHSIVLMAVSDAEYKFLYVDIGAYGSEGDSSIFRKCEFGKALGMRRLRVPQALPIAGKEIPHIFLADDAFPLSDQIMKPFKPKKKSEGLTKEETVFNYRLSRARRCVENSFGILCARWICLGRTLFMNPARAQKVVAACCVLHNWLMNDAQHGSYCPPGFADTEHPDGSIKPGTWRSLVTDTSMFHANLPRQNAGRPTHKAQEIREHLKCYFNSEVGKLEWQDERIFYA